MMLNQVIIRLLRTISRKDWRKMKKGVILAVHDKEFVGYSPVGMSVIYYSRKHDEIGACGTAETIAGKTLKELASENGLVMRLNDRELVRSRDLSANQAEYWPEGSEKRRQFEKLACDLNGKIEARAARRQQGQ